MKVKYVTSLIQDIGKQFSKRQHIFLPFKSSIKGLYLGTYFLSESYTYITIHQVT